MQERWRYCTREVCRLRSDRSRDRQIYSRKRHPIGGGEYSCLPDEGGNGGPTIPGRYCTGLCETETAEERCPQAPGKAKVSRG